MDEDFEATIRELLASGNKIAAIKRYREKTGVGLAEAKAAVESLEAGGSFTERVQPDDSDLTPQIVTLLGRGEKVEAVKLYRDRFRVGLKEAKEAVERIGEQNGIPASSGSGCLGVILLGIAVTVLTNWILQFPKGLLLAIPCFLNIPFVTAHLHQILRKI